MVGKIKSFHYDIFLVLLVIKEIFNEDKNEISLIVNSAKTNLINISYYFFISEIIVNGNSAEKNNYINMLTSSQNNIIIKFKTRLTTCINMFSNLNNILYVNTTNFDSSKVKSMYQMFSGCTSLKSLNINNLDTSLVTNMYGVWNV